MANGFRKFPPTGRVDTTTILTPKYPLNKITEELSQQKKRQDRKAAFDSISLSLSLIMEDMEKFVKTFHECTILLDRISQHHKRAKEALQNVRDKSEEIF